MRKYLGYISGILFCLITFLIFFKIGKSREESLKKNGVLSTAYVSDYEIGSKGSGTNVSYRFNVNDKTFLDSKRVLKMPFSLAPNFRGKFFPIIYLPNDPTVNTLLITPDDFFKFQKIFPDSLNWVRQYLSEK